MLATNTVRSNPLIRAAWPLLLASLSAFCTTPAFSQDITLTPEQQSMLNQLPPAQRQQALRALEGLRQTRSAAEQTEDEDGDEGPLDGTGFEDDSLQEIEEEPRAEAGSALVVSFYERLDLPVEDVNEIRDDYVLQGVLGSHFYQLDQNGVLELPGLSNIPILGLTEPQIVLRLQAESALSRFYAEVSILDAVETGLAALAPFGYELFESDKFEFEPDTSGPVPTNYVLGPGDTVRVQLFGNVSNVFDAEVSRDGVLNLPQLGPITVAGLSFAEFRRELDSRVDEMLIGTQVSATMESLRTIRIFVLGDANRPGSYTVESLATISSALYRSGGVSPVGTMRDIQLKRSGEIVARLDVYDLLLNGDTSGDARLQSGDVIFIPPVGAQVGVDGGIKRPAIYETKSAATAAEVIALAGGFTADAFPSGAVVHRIGSGGNRTVVSFDANRAVGEEMFTSDGDVIAIPTVLPVVDGAVTLEGHVQRPGPYQWRPGMRLTDILQGFSSLKPGADPGYVLVRREHADGLRIQVVSANLSAAIASATSIENIELRPRDTIFVFSLEFGRQRVIQPILDELKLQAKFDEPFREVSVSGQVLAPGIYPLEPEMRVSDLIRAGGDLKEGAYTARAEIVRYEKIGDDLRRTRIIDVDLSNVIDGDASADFVLQQHDSLRISGLPEWNSLWSVELEGEFKFPGIYRIRNGETLTELLQRAGGFTDGAFPEGAIFIRESLRQREQEQFEILARRLESDLNSLSLEDGGASADTLQVGQSLLTQLRGTKAVGRLVIDLNQLAASSNRELLASDFELRDGDKLLVPKLAQEVTVIGETQQNTSHLYDPGLGRDDYIAMSGGLTRRADEKLIYVVRASGAVVARDGSKWFARRSRLEMRPGDTIVVPLETDRVRPITLWTNITQILYQAAIAVAAINSFNN